MKAVIENDAVVHIVYDNVQHALTLNDIKILQPVIKSFHDNTRLKFYLKDKRVVIGIVKNYSYEEIFAPVEETIPLEITLLSDELIWFYEIENIEIDQ